jgi:hypothetical protein
MHSGYTEEKVYSELAMACSQRPSETGIDVDMNINIRGG